MGRKNLLVAAFVALFSVAAYAACPNCAKAPDAPAVMGEACPVKGSAGMQGSGCDAPGKGCACTKDKECGCKAKKGCDCGMKQGAACDMPMGKGMMKEGCGCHKGGMQGMQGMQGMKGMMGMKHGNGMGCESGGCGCHKDDVLATLNLTDDQKAKLQALRQEFKMHMMDERQAMGSRPEPLLAMSNGVFSKEMFKKEAMEHMSAHLDAKADYYQKIWDMLTPDQQKKLADLAAKK